MATIKALIELGCEVYVVHWDDKKLTPYKMPNLPKLHQYPRSLQSLDSLRSLTSRVDPDITVVSGWQDSVYLEIIKCLRKQNKTVVLGIDQQWYGTIKQHIAATLGKFKYFKRLYSHVWIPGVYQYEYARKLGFEKDDIVFDLYSADLPLFKSVFEQRFLNNTYPLPHRFLYVGRYEAVKGLDTLLTAWQHLGEERQDWDLHLVGNGSLREKLSSTSGIVVKDFMQPEDLISEVLKAGCFVMPSKGEPWGVVAHEMAATGLPLIASNVVGSASSFLIHGLNGYLFNKSNAFQLTQAMRQIINHTKEDLINMGQASSLLSERISPLTSAKNLLSVINK